MTALPHDRIKHLKLIQNIITCMAGNSARMKTWAVSLATVFVLSGVTGTSHWLMVWAGPSRLSRWVSWTPDTCTSSGATENYTGRRGRWVRQTV